MARLPVGCLYVFFSGGVLFFLLFAAAGFAFLYFLTLRPLWRAHESLAWTATPCEILTSREHKGTDSDGHETTELQMVYAYDVHEGHYQSERYAFRPVNSASEVSAVVQRLPRGARTICYVDPVEPAEAVIDREIGAFAWLGLFPGLFIAIGLGGAIGSALTIPVMVRRARAQGDPGLERARPTPTSMPASLRTPFTSAPSGLHVLPLREPRGSATVVAWVAAIFWNGITGLVGGGALWGLLFQEGDMSTRLIGVPLLLLFLTPFVAVGALIAYFAGRQTMLYIGPRPHVSAPRQVALGQTFDLRWEITGRVMRIRSMRIDLEGREEAKYTQGTDKKTDTRVFARVPIFESADPRALERGHAVATLPRDSMHSFAAMHNRIYWIVRVRADVPHWPDIDDDFVLEVVPPGSRA
jgi:hypothetical protein